MRRRGSWLAGALLLLVLAAPRAEAVEVNVVIQGFEYRPSSIEIDPGDVVSWTNLDATVHTVTADDGSFDSGRMGEGQRYSIAFNQPGTYPYHCDLHDHFGTVTVRGSASPPSDTTTTTAPPPTSTTAAPATTTTAAPAVPGPTSTTTSATAPPDSVVAAAPTSSVSTTTSTTAAAAAGAGAAFEVVGPPLVQAPEPLGPLWIVAAIALLSAVLASQLWFVGPGVAPARLRGLAALLTGISGAVHLQLRFVLDYPEPTATFFVLQAVAAVVVAALVASDRGAGVWLGVTFHIASLVAFAVSRSVGLFGFHERGWDPSPQAAVAIACEVAALGILAVLALGLARRSDELALNA